jgi:DNA polymerase I
VSNQLESFRGIWLTDFEFRQPPGERPTPVCLVAREYRSGRTIRLWDDELRCHPAPPFPVGPETLYVSYLASAEVGCHLALGWPPPERILDLYVEFRALTNGLPTPYGRSILGALAWFGLDALGASEKAEMRDLVLRGGPYTPEERRALLEYCESDVTALGRLLPAMLPSVDLPRALLRGRSMVAAARIERAGVPIDVFTYDTFKANWDRVLWAVVRESDVYNLYEGLRFKLHRFAEWLVDNDLAWPHLDTGNLASISTAGFSAPQTSPAHSKTACFPGFLGIER